MKYTILDSNQNPVKEIESASTSEEILRNYPLGYKTVEVKDYSKIDEVV